MEIKIYTDGACVGNPGPGGWAAVILSENKKKASGYKLIFGYNLIDSFQVIWREISFSGRADN